jgi:ubiquinone/menaquinone biosynthesis C-methylase UbiE
LDNQETTFQEGGEINRGYLDHISRWSGTVRVEKWRALKERILFGNELRLLLLPLLLIASVFFLVGLKIFVRFHASGSTSILHNKAHEYIDGLIEQYPLHLYPVVAKALELAYLKDRLATLIENQGRILEVAVGEGTLSARLFGHERHITALDLNPYSLVKASTLEHVKRAIVCDGLNPPIREGTYDLLLSLNLLHHVTQKTATVSNWARIARILLFNENTPFWASGWTAPYLLKKLGLRKMAARKARAIEVHSLQCLEGLDKLDEHIRPHGEIKERVSFMSERTFFYASVFSFLMRCYGPPTPALLKRIFLGPLHRVVLPLTKKLADLLIVFDAYQNRSTDTFVVFLVHSRKFSQAQTGQDLVCPRCRILLSPDQRCAECQTTYLSKDGMLFLLPQELGHIAEQYKGEISTSISAQHL